MLESIRKGNKDPVFADPRTGISERIKVLQYNLYDAERDAKKIDSKILPTTEIKARISQLQKILKDLEKELL